MSSGNPGRWEDHPPVHRRAMAAPRRHRQSERHLASRSVPPFSTSRQSALEPPWRPARQDFAAVALLRDEAGNQTYELGGPSFDLVKLARTISAVTGTRVTYRDLPVEEYVDVLQQGGLDEATARFVAAIDTSIARGELATNGQDLAQLLGRQPTPLTELVRAAYENLKVSDSVQSS